MKIIVTHSAPDLDAVTSVWLIKRFLQNWSDAEVQFVPAGSRMEGSLPGSEVVDVIEKVKGNEVIQVDTGLGPLDHHQTMSDKVCGASLTWDYVRKDKEMLKDTDKIHDREEAITRIVNIVIEDDHFKDVFRPDPTADYFEFMLGEILDGLKLQKPDDDKFYVEFIMACLDAVMHSFENRIWAEKEIKENGKAFDTKWGKGIGFETINDDVIKLSQKMGFTVVVRKDPRKGYVRIKANPKFDIDFTNIYEQLKKMDPEATWFLHVSKKMLLNGTPKNPKMKPTTLKLDDIISVLKK
ncbi:MAG: DHH family phosphoesterase [Patescibacteria group bacterium]